VDGKKRKRDDDNDDLSIQVSSKVSKQPKRVGPQLLKEFHSDILQHSMFPFVCTNDLTTFASTCGAASELVNDYRRSLPVIVRQKVTPMQMSYINFRRGNRRLPGEPFDVHSAKTASFLLKTKEHGTVEVEICLTEYLWTELNGTRRYRGLLEEDRCVWVE
jgi:hypothetical protein